MDIDYSRIQLPLDWALHSYYELFAGSDNLYKSETCFAYLRNYIKNSPQFTHIRYYVDSRTPEKECDRWHDICKANGLYPADLKMVRTTATPPYLHRDTFEFQYKDLPTNLFY